MDKGSKHPSPRKADVVNRRDSVETGTESLTEERVHIGSYDQYKYKQAQNEKTGNLERVDDEDEDEFEDIEVYDSLEVLPQANRNINILHTKYLDTHKNHGEETRYAAQFLCFFCLCVYVTTLVWASERSRRLTLYILMQTQLNLCYMWTQLLLYKTRGLTSWFHIWR